MCFRTVEFLDIARMDQLRWKYGIRNGFIVNEVTHRSTAEKLGIRRGDVIVSFNGISCYLPQFEDFLLSLGLDFLRGMKTVNDFKLEVHDLLGKVKRTITLPVQFSDASEY
uniref:PDZ domain-containing protein n=1 Tax=Arundo donax TaxID=35708 RepID=A0A0A9GLY2_ARUDO